ncbi:formimidoylglutamase [Olivibacter sp. SDN3]|uniref:formimidoylglutamase n=1 Tax=Olivibacter sp. SDN3 TaxID=2764720 RepID=UPI00165168AC|nr:formimidoylglutamase [Olivibacter sp. SDN3]QNL48536.1 formimidoylglutamase [Olivibacter sp. SDN3]
MEKRTTDIVSDTFYNPPTKSNWDGRNDGTADEHLRWHQWVKLLHLDDLHTVNKRSIILLGFACDEGVIRNKGRLGASNAPLALRSALSNVPIPVNKIDIYDVGDVLCPNGDMETAQFRLAVVVKEILSSGNFPILIGGGHEISYGHYLGIAKYLNKEDTNLGIINFDAHFDIRKADENGNSSGTAFWQIAQHCKNKKQTFNYLALGIQRISNTTHLFQTANTLNVQYEFSDEFLAANKTRLQERIISFLKTTDHIYLTIDMDVFAAAFAPGVSASAYNGIYPDDTFFSCLRTIINSKQTLSIDLAEVNPTYDLDNRTSKLAAAILFEIITMIAD